MVCMPTGSCAVTRIVLLTCRQGHFTYQCKKPRPYVSRPSRTEQLENPRALARAQPSVQVPEEFKTKSVLDLMLISSFGAKHLVRTGTANRILEAREKERLEKGKEPARKKAKQYVEQFILCSLLQPTSCTVAAIVEQALQILIVAVIARLGARATVAAGQTLIRPQDLRVGEDVNRDAVHLHECWYSRSF